MVCLNPLVHRTKTANFFVDLSVWFSAHEIHDMALGFPDTEAAIEYSSDKDSSSRTRAEVLDPVGGHTVPVPNDGFSVLSADDLRFVELCDDQSGHQLASVLARPDVYFFENICEKGHTVCNNVSRTRTMVLSKPAWKDSKPHDVM